MRILFDISLQVLSIDLENPINPISIFISNYNHFLLLRKQKTMNHLCQFSLYQQQFENELNLLHRFGKSKDHRKLSFQDKHILPWNQIGQEYRENLRRNTSFQRMKEKSLSKDRKKLNYQNRPEVKEELKMAQIPITFGVKTPHSQDKRQKRYSFDASDKEGDKGLLMKSQAYGGFLRSLNGRESFAVVKSPRLVFLERKFKLKRNDSAKDSETKPNTPQSQKDKVVTSSENENKIFSAGSVSDNRQHLRRSQRRPSTANKGQKELRTYTPRPKSQKTQQ